MKTVKLNNGVEMPLLGLGVFRISDPQVCEDSVYQAIKAGYRLIDTAAAYENEEAVGRGIRRSYVPREELFITTKLWVQDAGYDNARKAFEKSLTKLQLDYLDLYLIHQPFGDLYGSWKAMEELYKEGRIRAIGVSNFYPDRLADLMVHHDIVPAVNQIETHPYWQQTGAQQYLQENNIQLESWSPFAQDPTIFDQPLLKGIARKHQRSVAQIILRWLTQRDIVVIPKSVNQNRILENINIFDFDLSADDMAAIATMDTGKTTIFDHHDPVRVKFLSGYRFNI
jgi:2,5-diketo-D-gluconate reductase A